MQTTGIKDEALHLVEELPDDASWDDPFFYVCFNDRLSCNPQTFLRLPRELYRDKRGLSLTLDIVDEDGSRFSPRPIASIESGAVGEETFRIIERETTSW